MTSILLLSRYGMLAASSRYRSYQYLPYLQRQGFQVTVAPLLDDRYLQRLYRGRATTKGAVAAAYARRVTRLLRSRSYDLIWLEKEALPWVPGWLEALLVRRGAPYLVDYDDALFHRYDQHPYPMVRALLSKKIDRVMREAALVVAGNSYLAARADAAGAKQIEQLPTVVDLDRYPPSEPPTNETFTIGWIGTPVTTRYLELVRPALKEVCAGGRARLVAIGSTRLAWDDVPHEVVPWSVATEVAQLQRFDVGIMPLKDSPWERGKCGFKLIQYMACGRPVIGSPVGVNSDIISDGVNGLPATSTEDWIRALRTLQHDAGLRRRMGAAGRAAVEARFCIQVTTPRLADLLRRAATK
jgi:glycosyltransferase involved in cell wall biosynthesis